MANIIIRDYDIAELVNDTVIRIIFNDGMVIILPVIHVCELCDPKSGDKSIFIYNISTELAEYIEKFIQEEDEGE